MRFTLPRFRHYLFSSAYRQILADAVEKDDVLHLKEWLARMNPKVYNMPEIINCENGYGGTMLMRARSLEVASLLLDHGASLKGMTPPNLEPYFPNKMVVVESEKNARLSAFLIERLRRDNGQTNTNFYLPPYITDNNFNTIKMWLCEEANPNPVMLYHRYEKEQLCSVLKIAIHNGAINIVQEVIKRLNKKEYVAREDFGCHPIVEALSNGNKKMITALIEAAEHNDILSDFEESLKANRGRDRDIPLYEEKIQYRRVEVEKQKIEAIVPLLKETQALGATTVIKSKAKHKI